MEPHRIVATAGLSILLPDAPRNAERTNTEEDAARRRWRWCEDEGVLDCFAFPKNEFEPGVNTATRCRCRPGHPVARPDRAVAMRRPAAEFSQPQGATSSMINACWRGQAGRNANPGRPAGLPWARKPRPWCRYHEPRPGRICPWPA